MKKKLKTGDVCVVTQSHPYGSLVEEGDLVVIKRKYATELDPDGGYFIEWDKEDHIYDNYQVIDDVHMKKIGEL